MKKSIVYAATLRSSGDQYIGCTKSTLLRRKANHFAESKRGKSGKFLEALRVHGKEAFSWEIEKEFSNHAEALSFERELITKRQTIEFGLNTCQGGGKNGGRIRTTEERQHLRNKAIEWQSKVPGGFGSVIQGKLQAFYNTEPGRVQLATRKETANRAEVRAKMSRSHGGKPVEVLKDNQVVAVYQTQGECAEALGIRQGNLNSCLLARSGAKSLRGYTFRFAPRSETIPPDPS